jgi:hypothetical protein
MFARAVRAYGTVIGELVWTSNYCLSAFEALFTLLATPKQRELGLAMWHTLSSDSAKLKLLEALVVGNNELTASTRDRILWAIDKAMALAEKRNDAVHSLTTFDTSTYPLGIQVSAAGTRPKRYARLSGTDLKRRYREVKGDLYQLGQYVLFLFIYASAPDLHRLPRKPRLRSV